MAVQPGEPVDDGLDAGVELDAGAGAFGQLGGAGGAGGVDDDVRGVGGGLGAPGYPLVGGEFGGDVAPVDEGADLREGLLAGREPVVGGDDGGDAGDVLHHRGDDRAGEG